MRRDLDGEDRMADVAPDLGAYEYKTLEQN